MTKFALPALILVIFGLFYLSVTPQPSDAPPDVAAPRVEPPPNNLAAVETARDDREQQLSKTIEGIRAELKRLSDDAKANSDKIAQAATLRSDLQDSKSSIDSAAQGVRDQIDTLRSDQIKALTDAREATDKAAQALRQEVAASQAKLVDQVGETLKASAARSEALVQRVDAMKKDIDDVKKSMDEEQQGVFNISPGLALIVALASLVLGPFVARQLTANQLAAARKQAAADAAAAKHSESRKTEVEPPLAPSSAAEPAQEALPLHEAPPHGEEASSHHDDNTARDREKV